MELSFKPIGPELVDDYLGLFDAAFGEFPDWCGCYCAYYDDRARDDEWDPGAASAARHRAVRAQRIRDGQASGVLAYAARRAVGWCNAGMRSEFVNLRGYGAGPSPAAATVGCVMCFVVLPQWRGRGVATGLLGAAEDYLRTKGCTVVEAYPRALPRDDVPWSAASYKGPLTMYEKAGYQVHRDEGRYLVVRRAL